MAQDEEEPIPLEGEEDQPLPVEQAPTRTPAGTSTRIQAFGAAAGPTRPGQKLKRPLNLTGAGATRCRVFHSKVTVAALDNMVAQINEWLDGEQIEIKCVNQVVGVLEGKTPEPNVIVMVWY